MAEAKSGVIAVTTAGTAVQGPDTGPGEYIIGADPANTGFIYVGNDGAGDVASTNGFKLGAGSVVIVVAGSLSAYWFDSSVNGEKATWLKAAPGGAVRVA